MKTDDQTLLLARDIVSGVGAELNDTNIDWVAEKLEEHREAVLKATVEVVEGL